MAEKKMEEWDLWFPGAAANGLSFARGQVDSADVMLVHSAPPTLNVAVRSLDGTLKAEGKDLEKTDDSPVTRLTRQGDTIVREDIWPTEEDIGRLILLPGGEAGVLLQWWNAPDKSEWRWKVEFYNHK